MELTDPMDYIRLMVGTLAVDNAVLRRRIEELIAQLPKAAPPPEAPNDG